MEDLKKIFDLMQKGLKTSENKKIDASARKAAQEEYLKEQENILNTFDFDSLKEEEKYKKKAELYRNVSNESEKLESYRKDLLEQEKDFKKLEKEISSIQKTYDKYKVEYEQLIKSKKQYELALDNQNLTPEMKVEREARLNVINIKLQKIRLLLEISIKEHINYLPKQLKEEINKQLEELENQKNEDVENKKTEQENHPEEQTNEDVENKKTEPENNPEEQTNEPLETQDPEELAKQAMIIPEDGRKKVTKISKAQEKLKSIIKGHSAKAALAIAGSIAALAIIVANPVLIAALPAAYVVHEFNKGRKM